METFQTNFNMSGVPTDVTVASADNETFEIILNLVDFYEGEEIPAEGKESDAKLRKNADGRWELVGESKISLNSQDLENLGMAIERDYLRRK